LLINEIGGSNFMVTYYSLWKAMINTVELSAF